MPELYEPGTSVCLCQRILHDVVGRREPAGGIGRTRIARQVKCLAPASTEIPLPSVAAPARRRHPLFAAKCPRNIAGVVLTNGDIDHVLGLFQLREWHPLAIYATRRVREGLERNALLATLARFSDPIVWRAPRARP